MRDAARRVDEEQTERQPATAALGEAHGVMFKAAGATSEASRAANLSRSMIGAEVGETARQGFGESSSEYPHRERIERAFGEPLPARAHTGDAATAACDQLGAEAYAMGSDVAFASDRPSLHTAAHEAAHVFQQAPGPQRKAGPSTESNEQQADAIADQVVAGESVAGQLPAAKPSRVAGLAKLGAAGVRAAIASDPSLARDIERFFAEGNADPALDSVLAAAYPGGTPEPALVEPEKAAAELGPEEQATVDKAPTGAGTTLPADLTGSKALTKGTFSWTLKAETSSRPRFDADFKADETKVEAKTISFGQTVVNQLGAKRFYPGGTTASPDKNKATYEPYEESTKHTRMDHHPGSENDPYYGAQWSQADKKWVKETVDWKPGSSTKGVASVSAKMWDAPERLPVAREGQGDAVTEFETVAMVLETREPLGAIKWGMKIEDKPEAPLVLTGATPADCVDAPSAEWGAAMDKFYEAKFDTILDDYDVGKADLKAGHQAQLDTLATKMKANAALKAQLGGACDLTGDQAFNEALALKRAETARDYLISKGVPAGQLEVQSYSFDWARVEAAAGKSEGKNRRVQIWLR